MEKNEALDRLYEALEGIDWHKIPERLRREAYATLCDELAEMDKIDRLASRYID